MNVSKMQFLRRELCGSKWLYVSMAVLLGWSPLAGAGKIFIYKDESGTKHAVYDESEIPEKYRASAGTLKSSASVREETLADDPICGSLRKEVAQKWAALNSLCDIAKNKDCRLNESWKVKRAELSKLERDVGNCDLVKERKPDAKETEVREAKCAPLFRKFDEAAAALSQCSDCKSPSHPTRQAFVAAKKLYEDCVAGK